MVARLRGWHLCTAYTVIKCREERREGLRDVMVSTASALNRPATRLGWYDWLGGG